MINTKYRWLILLIAVLLVSNLTLAFFYFFGGKINLDKRKEQGDYAMKVYKEIGLTETQIDTFRVLKDEFFKEMKPIWSEIRTLKDSLYKNMENEGKDSSSMRLLSDIAQKSALADKKMYDHFAYLRGLCNQEQQVRFDTIIPKLVNRSWRRK